MQIISRLQTQTLKRIRQWISCNPQTNNAHPNIMVSIRCSKTAWDFAESTLVTSMSGVSAHTFIVREIRTPSMRCHRICLEAVRKCVLTLTLNILEIQSMWYAGSNTNHSRPAVVRGRLFRTQLTALLVVVLPLKSSVGGVGVEEGWGVVEVWRESSWILVPSEVWIYIVIWFWHKR